MTIKRTSYSNYDGDPAVLYVHDDGLMSAYVYINGKWKMIHEAEVFSKGRVYPSKQEWAKAFGDIPAPPQPEGQGSTP
jgi:hypothetical protein